MINPIQKLEEWNSKHKARCCQIHIEDGYGATCWIVELYGENGKKVYACETSYDIEKEKEEIIVRNEEHDYIGCYVNTAANPKTLYVGCLKDPDDWPGLQRVLLASIDAFNKL